jgi:hypothetical protein
MLCTVPKPPTGHVVEVDTTWMTVNMTVLGVDQNNYCDNTTLQLYYINFGISLVYSEEWNNTDSWLVNVTDLVPGGTYRLTMYSLSGMVSSDLFEFPEEITTCKLFVEATLPLI